MDWQPIDTVPRSGEVLLRVQRAGCMGRMVAHWLPGGHCIEDHPPVDAGWYFWSGYNFRPLSDQPTHWASLPSVEVE